MAVVAVVAAAVLALLTAAVATGSALLAVDDVAARAVAAHRPPALVAVARALTWLGSQAVLAPLTLAVGLALRARTRSWRPLAALALAGTGAWASTTVLKELLARPRPDGALVAAGGWAFPSGHCADSAAWWLTAALVVAPRLPPHRRDALLAAGAALALVVGATRLVLGVHHTTDVVGGWSLGVLWAAAASRLVRGPAPHAPAQP